MNRKYDLELLAPAGSIESFFAALNFGADAVYCGLKEFSARTKAKNFSLNELEQMIHYAHHLKRKVYVALNTLIKEEELGRLVEVLGSLSESEIDGLIIQDLGVWRVCRKYFPNLELHGSTQLTVHNKEGVETLAEMGFTRAVLARELSLREISSIAKHTDLELEHFIHGALCYSISGNCFFSSFITGKSGNRGRCVQPCRRQYEVEGKKGAYFSPSDLCAIEHVAQMADNRVISFKIEGRMKNSEYVATVVKAYRLVLDAPKKKRNKAVQEAKELLTNAYGRPMTSGLLTGKPAKNLADPFQKGGIGKFCGDVQSAKGTSLTFKTGETIHVGDRLRIQPINDLDGRAFTIKELFTGNSRRKRADRGVMVRISTPFANYFQPGDNIYKIGGGKIFTMSAEACARQLKGGRPTANPVRLNISCTIDTLSIRGENEICELNRCYPVETEPAIRSPLSRERLLPIFTKTGHPELGLEQLICDDLPPVVIKPSKLKEIRRNYYRELAELTAKNKSLRLDHGINMANKGISTPVTRKASETNKISACICRPEELDIFDEKLFDQIIIPLRRDMVDALKEQLKQKNINIERIIWDIPAIIYDQEADWIEEIIKELIATRQYKFRLNNIGHFHYFRELDQAYLISGPLLYTLNSQAAYGLHDLGISELTLNIEDDQNNIKHIMTHAPDIPISLTIYGPARLLTSRIPLQKLAQKATIKGGNDLKMHMTKRNGLTTVTADKEFSLLGQLHTLKKIGQLNYVIDFSHCGWLSKRGSMVMEALRNDTPLEDTTIFNFERGLE
ncbi:MAG: DUF3656 domain-containing protein [Desulfobulbaceae bacterium]|nr:DUF3656 domain-containing protein [Desulfobulbaceae bacterium]